MDMVRAKFQSHYVAQFHDGGVSVHMMAVYSSDPDSENRKFSDATPSGTFTMQVKAGPVADWFKANEGKKFYLDMTVAPD